MERQPDLDAERIAAILTATTTYSAGSASINACRAVARLGGARPAWRRPTTRASRAQFRERLPRSAYETLRT